MTFKSGIGALYGDRAGYARGQRAGVFTIDSGGGGVTLFNANALGGNIRFVLYRGF